MGSTADTYAALSGHTDFEVTPLGWHNLPCRALPFGVLCRALGWKTNAALDGHMLFDTRTPHPHPHNPWAGRRTLLNVPWRFTYSAVHLVQMPMPHSMATHAF